MSGKNRSHSVYLTVVGKRVAFLPAGIYSVHLDDTWIESGSVKVKLRIIKSLILAPDFPKIVSASELMKLQGLKETADATNPA